MTFALGHRELVRLIEIQIFGLNPEDQAPLGLFRCVFFREKWEGDKSHAKQLLDFIHYKQPTVIAILIRHADCLCSTSSGSWNCDNWGRDGPYNACNSPVNFAVLETIVSICFSRFAQVRFIAAFSRARSTCIC